MIRGYGEERGKAFNLADLALNEAARDKRVVAHVLVGEVAVVERYRAVNGRVDVFIKTDPASRARYDIPVMWGRHRWELTKGDVGFLAHTHDDSSAAFDDRKRRRPEMLGRHNRVTPVFLPFEPVILTDQKDARWSADSESSDLTTFGPGDEVFFLEGGSYIIVKTTGAISFLPAAGRGVAIGGGAEVSKILSASATWDPPSLANLTTTSTTVTVEGAAVGDVVSVTHTTATNGFLLYGLVTSPNTVTVTLLNATGGTVNVDSGTLKVLVHKVI